MEGMKIQILHPLTLQKLGQYTKILLKFLEYLLAK